MYPKKYRKYIALLNKIKERTNIFKVKITGLIISYNNKAGK
ncbi:hypothetical protein HMPREF9555_02086 [Selenomonas artemidis F0399]|uniref:Uncharacterized protein n=1 Tax=Selenomonas artemidis F0399 TaxID=749551 RepID=E7N4Z1_9FIRM|nr:hypothetical protein HMPREF9555_02086 [Selenomonas artemidis F0399]